MLYKVITARILNDGSVVEGKRKQLFIWPKELRVGGLYFLEKGRLYRVVEIVPQ